MTNVLFICGKARMRSPTAADILARWPGIDTDFAGISNDADEKLSLEQIQWADMVFVMERRQKKRLRNQFGPNKAGLKLVSLDIPDNFNAHDPVLVEILTKK